MPSTSSKPRPKPNDVPVRDWSFEAIGTHFWIAIYHGITDEQWQHIKYDIQSRVEIFDKTYSRFRDDSLVAQVAARAGSYHFPEDANQLFELYRQLYDATDGQVSPLVGGLLDDLGYDAQYSMRSREVRDVPVWDDSMRFEAGILKTQRPYNLDFGAAGKGYLIDSICDLLQNHGVTAYCVDGSGDLRVQGVAPGLRIGIEHPADASSVIGVVELSDAALCVSAPNRRRWGDLHHIVQPKTGKPVQGVATTVVVAATAAEADGLTTALFMVEPDKLKQFQFEYLVLYDDYSIKRSAGFPAQLFIEDPYHG